LGNVQKAASLAELSALIEADSRHGTNAAQAVMLALQSAKTLEWEPTVISQIARANTERTAVDALEQTLNRVAMPQQSLTQLQEAFDHAAEDKAAGTGFKRGLIGVFLMEWNAFDEPPDRLRELVSLLMTDPLHPDAVAPADADKVLENLAAQKQFCAEYWNQRLAAQKEPFPARLETREIVLARLDEAISKQYLLDALLLTNAANVSVVEAEGLASLRLAQTAVALERFRAARAKRYPESLDELSPTFLPAVPQDPFCGQTLHYERRENGYLLYIIGLDLKDYKGSGSNKLTFRVLRPPNTR
jgi:hypothetical protein